jgi:hypothetical protein
MSQHPPRHSVPSAHPPARHGSAPRSAGPRDGSCRTPRCACRDWRCSQSRRREGRVRDRFERLHIVAHCVRKQCSCTTGSNRWNSLVNLMRSSHLHQLSGDAYGPTDSMNGLTSVLTAKRSKESTACILNLEVLSMESNSMSTVMDIGTTSTWLIEWKFWESGLSRESAQIELCVCCLLRGQLSR